MGRGGERNIFVTFVLATLTLQGTHRMLMIPADLCELCFRTDFSGHQVTEQVAKQQVGLRYGTFLVEYSPNLIMCDLPGPRTYLVISYQSYH